MVTAFQKLCIRNEPGFAYDKSAMADISDGSAFSEVLCKITSKCDTSLLLLGSHKGPFQNFEVKLVGLRSPQSHSTSVTSAVFSGIKKGLSFLNGSSVEAEEPLPSDDEQVAAEWDKISADGFHGMQVVALVDKQMMPDNECRSLYGLHQYMVAVAHSVTAYYMFQKPNDAFCFQETLSADSLKEEYPGADTFAVALVWRFVKDPLTAGRIRATPIVGNSRGLNSSMASPIYTPKSSVRQTSTSMSSKKSSSVSSHTSMSERRKMNVLDTSTSSSARKAPRIGENISTSIFTASTPKPSFSTSKSSVVSSSTSRSTRKSPVKAKNTTASMDSDEQNSNKTEKFVSTTVTTTKKKITELRDGSGTVKKIVEETTPKVIQTLRRSIVEEQNEDQEEEDAEEEEEEAMEDAEDFEEEAMEVEAPAPRTPLTKKTPPALPRKLPTPSNKYSAPPLDEIDARPVVAEDSSPAKTPRRVGRPAKGTPVKAPVAAPASRKRKAPLEEAAVEEITVKSKKPRGAQPAPAEDVSTSVFDASCLPFDDNPGTARAAPKGRKSMAGRASLSVSAQEWPAEESSAMLHFYDNLNPVRSETSRVALTCKYALLQYDRDLSSKLLFTWLGAKGRKVLTDVTNFNLDEAQTKPCVVALYRSLSGGQSEASRVAFTIKFIAAQYGVTVASKQVFTWLKDA